jgi:UrcA family protein
MNKTIRTTLYTACYCAFGAAVLCTLTTPAIASDQDVPTKTVRFDDLNIAKAAGAKVLYRRIQAAARDVCPLSISRGPYLAAVQHACIQRAIDDAVRSVNAVALTELRFGSALRLADK